MSLPSKPVIAGIFIGATALAITGSGGDIGAFADEMLAPAFDASKLVVFDDSLFSVQTEPSVSTEVLKSSTIRKIEFGRTSFVKITTTSSGTYSTDGLYSPHFRYPGIHVEQLTRRGTPVTSVAFWSDASGWVAAPLVDAGSVLTIR